MRKHFYLLLLLLTSVTYSNSVWSQCNISNTGTAATPTCSNQSLSLGAGESRNMAFVAGEKYTFTFTNNAQSSGICINGTRITQNPYTYTAPSTGNLAVGSYRNTGTWTSSSAVLTYRKETPSFTAINSASRCDTGSVVLSVAANFGTINWYTTASGGSSIATGTTYTTPSLTATTTYYVDVTANGCTSARSAVNATINPIPVSPIGFSVTKCGTGVLKLSPVIQSGLVFNLDAASYSGTGNSWDDLSGNNKNGTLNNVTYSSSNGGYLEFNGSTSNVAMGQPLASGSSYTYESWVYRTSTVGAQNIISTNRAPFWFNGTTFSAGIGGNYSLVTTPNSTLNTWMHVAVTFNDSTNTMTLYLDGVQVAQNTNVTASFVAQNLFVGIHSDTTGASGLNTSFIGRISHARVYNRALSPSEMSYNFQITRGRYYPLTRIVNWYSAPSGGNLVAYNTSLFTPLISGNTTYYIETEDSTSGCISTTRAAVNINFSGTNWTKLYETTNPSRDGSGSIVYAPGFGKIGGVASAFTGTFNKVKYRMELTIGGTPRWTEVSFDTWTGLTTAGLQVPDMVNLLTHQRNVFNMEVTSNMPGVNTGKFDTGRIEMWPYNYGQTPSGFLTPVGSNSTYDWDDSYTVGSGDHGSYQIHNVTNGYRQTIFGWNMHRTAGPPEIGIGTSTGINPDWTGVNTNGSTGFKVQVFVGTPMVYLLSGNINQTLCPNTAISNITYKYVSPAAGITVLNLPAGLTTTLDTTNKQVTISGIPTAFGSYAIIPSGSFACAPDTLTGNIAFVSVPTITTTPATRCGAGTVTLGATASAGTINWYAAATGGSLLATGNSYTTPSISANTTYYVEATGSACPSIPRTAILAAVVNNVFAMADTVSTCGDSVLVTATVGYNSYLWSTGDTSRTSWLKHSGKTFVTGTTGSCSYTDTMLVVLPGVSVQFTDTTICSGTPITLKSVQKNGLDFDGTNDHITLPAGVYFDDNTYTVESWIYVKSYNSWSRLFDFGNGTSNNNVLVSLSNNTSGKIAMEVYVGSSTQNITAPNVTPLNTWTHVACVLNGGTGYIYINGTMVASGPMQTPSNINRTLNYVGRSNWGVDGYSNFKLDEFRIWNYARSQDQIRTAMNSELVGNEKGLITYLNFDDGDAAGANTSITTVNNKANPALSGTLTNFALSGAGSNIVTGAPVLQNTRTWSTTATTANITVAPNTTTSYTYTETRNGISCAKTINVNTIAKPTATITASSTTSCSGDSVTLTATSGSGLTYKWLLNNSPISGATSATYKTITAGSYRVLVTNTSSCFDTSVATVISVGTRPTVATTTPATRCGTGTVTLSATASAGTVKWYTAATGGSALDSATTFTTPSLSTTTTYYVDATNNGCTTGTRTAVIATVNTIPTVTASTPANRCGSGTVTLGATASAGTLNWYAAATGGTSLATGTSFTTPSISATTTYYVDATNNGCTTATRTAVIATVNTIPTVTATTPATRCGAGTVTLKATASAGTLNWYAAATGGTSLATDTSFTTPSISATTTYYVDATNNGCTTATRTAVIATVNPNLTASVSVSASSTSICGSTPITFTATPINGGTTPAYQWKKNGVNVGTSSNTYVLNGAVNGDSVYVVLTSNATPCLVNVTSNSNGIKLTSSTVTPSVAVVATPGTTICAGTSVTFTATATNGGTTPAYQWIKNGVNVGTNSNVFTTLSLLTNDTIKVVLTSNASCVSTATATSNNSVMTVNAIPTVTVTTPATRCGTGTVTLGATASAGTINWYAAATGGTSLATGTSFTTPSISATTTYYVDATNNGCTTATRTAVIATVNTIPTVAATTPANRCGAGTVTLKATASAGTLNWYAAATGGTSLATDTSFTTPSISATTTYYVDATNNGCTTATRTAVIATVNPNLTASVSVSASSTSICGSTPITFTATPINGGTTPAYQWKKNGVNVGTSSNTYVLNGAVNGDSVYVVLTSNATPCLVNVTSNSNGIKLTSSTVTPSVAVVATPGTTICAGTSVTFTATATNGGTTPAYQWIKNGVNVGTNSNVFTTLSLLTNDTIKVVLTSNASCVSTATATSNNSVMTVNAIPTVTVTTPATRCGTGTVTLGATASAGTINWYAAATGGTSLATGTSFTTPSISATTTYYVDATNNGCTTATRTAVIAGVNAKPVTSTISGRTSVHKDTLETYSVINTVGSVYNWTIIGGVKLSGGTTNSIVVRWDSSYTSGTVKVVETSLLGCSGDTVVKSIVSIVPVELMSFDAKRTKNKVTLTWETASELNNRGFEIERSIDNKNFEYLGSVKGQGTTLLVNNYNFNDDITALLNTGLNQVYYRLKQVDYNGNFEYTNTVSVSLDKTELVSAAYVTPNPFRTDIKVNITELNFTNAQIILTDAQGKQVKTFAVSLEKGANQIELNNLGDLVSGVYFIRITTETGTTHNIKLIKY